MDRYPLEQSDGTILNPGDWLEVTLPERGRCIGRFSGVWRHPDYGLTFRLNWVTEIDITSSGPADMVTCLLEHSEAAVAAIDTARIVPGPRRPKPPTLH